MRRLTVFLVSLAVLLAFAPGPATAAKKCKKGQAIAQIKGKAKCVKTCPKGQVKRKKGKVVRCVKPPAKLPGDDDQNITPVDEGSDTPDQPDEPAPDPAAVFADQIRHMYLLRTYTVPKPGNPSGTNTHSEEYGWCNDPGLGRLMAHEYEGIAYIYKSAGPYTILSGSADGSSGSGVIQYTQQHANFDEERGKTLNIEISWTGDTATVVHPEIGTYSFAKTIRSNENCT